MTSAPPAQKTARQPQWSMRNPAHTGPSVRPAYTAAIIIPYAAPRRSGGTRSATIAGAVAAVADDVTPCTKRRKRITGIEENNATASEETPKESRPSL